MFVMFGFNIKVSNINHKGVQRIVNEYAEERRIYKDLISKNEKYRHIKFCKQNHAAMLIVVILKMI